MTMNAAQHRTAANEAWAEMTRAVARRRGLNDAVRWAAVGCAHLKAAQDFNREAELARLRADLATAEERIAVFMSGRDALAGAVARWVAQTSGPGRADAARGLAVAYDAWNALRSPGGVPTPPKPVLDAPEAAQGGQRADSVETPERRYRRGRYVDLDLTYATGTPEAAALAEESRRLIEQRQVIGTPPAAGWTTGHAPIPPQTTERRP